MGTLPRGVIEEIRHFQIISCMVRSSSDLQYLDYADIKDGSHIIPCPITLYAIKWEVLCLRCPQKRFIQTPIKSLIDYKFELLKLIIAN